MSKQSDNMLLDSTPAIKFVKKLNLIFIALFYEIEKFFGI